MYAKGFFTILNDRGLHTRPSTELVKLASRYKSELTLRFKKCEVNAKSLLGILMLSAIKGSKITIEAKGIDAKEAILAIQELAKGKFNTDY